MANQLGARRDGTYRVMYEFYSIDYNNSGVPTPFPVQFNLGIAENVSEDVSSNKCNVMCK